jgi:hypothetical protein
MLVTIWVELIAGNFQSFAARYFVPQVVSGRTRLAVPQEITGKLQTRLAGKYLPESATAITRYAKGILV